MSRSVLFPRAEDFLPLVSGFTLDPPGARFGPRLLQHYEFIWIIEGEARVQFGPRRYHATQGSVLLRPPGVRDSYAWSPHRRTLHGYVQFRLHGDSRLPNDCPWIRRVKVESVLPAIFRHLLAQQTQPEPLRRSLLQADLALLWAAYVSGAVELERPLAPGLPPALERALAVLGRALGGRGFQALGAKDLARLSHSTPASLGRLFRKHLGLSPARTFRLLRLERVAAGLRRGGVSLKDLAQAWGFYDAFHLSREFRKVYGLSPDAFRRSPGLRQDRLSVRNPVIRVGATRRHHPA